MAFKLGLAIIAVIILGSFVVGQMEVNRARNAQNELAAIERLKDLHASQARLHAKSQVYASTLTDPRLTLREDLAKGKSGGYLFRLQPTREGYVVIASPVQGEGRRTFYTDQSMVIHENWGPEQATGSSPIVK